MNTPEKTPNPPVLQDVMAPGSYSGLFQTENSMKAAGLSAASYTQSTGRIQEAIQDIRFAEELSEHLLAEDQDIRTEADRAVAAAQRIDARERARRAREKGRKALEYRHIGGFGRTREVTVNEVPLGYQLLRYFAAVENALYVLYRMGHLYLPKDDIDMVRNVIEERIAALELTVVKAELFASGQFAVHEDAHEYMPAYARPTVDRMELHVRTRQADRFLNAIEGFDRVLGKLHAVAWFGELDDAETRLWQDQFRNEMREAGRLIALTVKGLRTRAEQRAGI